MRRLALFTRQFVTRPSLIVRVRGFLFGFYFWFLVFRSGFPFWGYLSISLLDIFLGFSYRYLLFSVGFF